MLYIGSPQSNKTISIGSLGSGTNSTIYIGRPGDNVYLRGSVYYTSTQVLTINSNVIQLNESSNLNNASSGSGIQIRDNSNDLAGFVIVTQDMNGYSFKAPNSPNVLRLDINSLVVNSGVNSAMVTLKNSSTLFNDSSFDLIVNNNVDGNYNGTGSLFVSSKSIFNNDVSMNTCLFVGSNASFNNDVSMNKRLFVGSNASFNNDVSMNKRLFVGTDTSFNGNIYVNKTGFFNSNVAINKTTVASGAVLDISGNMNQIGGVVFQF
jgi:hypothetical protein